MIEPSTPVITCSATTILPRVPRRPFYRCLTRLRNVYIQEKPKEHSVVSDFTSLVKHFVIEPRPLGGRCSVDTAAFGGLFVAVFWAIALVAILHVERVAWSIPDIGPGASIQQTCHHGIENDSSRRSVDTGRCI